MSCIECSSYIPLKYYHSLDIKCYQICPANYESNSNSYKCIACSTTLVYNNECLESCREGTYLNISEDSCIIGCDTTVNKECVPNCNKGYYFDVESKTCEKCIDSKPYVSKDKLTCYIPGLKGFYNDIEGYCENVVIMIC